MWEKISLSVSMSIGKAMFSSLMDKKEIAKNNKLLSDICKKHFYRFADTSLDNNDFYKFVNSEKFMLMIRNYYFTITDGIPKDVYFKNMINITSDMCPKCKNFEIEIFYNEIDELFCNELHKIIQRNPQLNAQLVLFIQANRVILQAISKGLDNLMAYFKSEEKEGSIINDKLIIDFHSVCNEEFSTINFSGISGAETKKARKLNELYVENQFYFYTKEAKSFTDIYRNEQENLIDIKNFFDFGKKIVVLGGAGFGKTTTLNYIYCNYETIFKNNVLKFKINLKDYASQIMANKLEIIDCLCCEFTKRIPPHKLKKYDVKSILSSYLSDGECLIIFDALDEVSSQNSRDRVRIEVETFCRVYYLNKVIITSREVGYLRNSFDDSFLHLKISLFNDQQIKKYSKKWDKINSNNNKFELFYKSFLNEVRVSKCEEIIRNPIILVLALIIFDSERKLPHKRVEFYRKCIDTFLISRETHKQAFELDDKLKSILGESMLLPKIANFKFLSQKKDMDYRFTKETLIESIFQSLEVQDRLNWNNSVGGFFKYLTERAELIIETDEDKYDFAHKTFNEYFLALYYAKNTSFSDLENLLDAWIGDSNDDELARLVMEVIIDKNDSEQHKNLMNYLFSKIEYHYNLMFPIEDFTYEYNHRLQAFVSIAFNLYKNGMMVPKYHNPYHQMLIRCPNLLDIYYHRLSIALSKCFDVNACYNLFLSEIDDDSEDSNKISKNIEILFWFNSYFYETYKIHDEFYGKLSEDLHQVIINFAPEKERIFNSNEIDLILDYYLFENYKKVMHSPIIFLMMFKLLLQKPQIDKYFNYLINFKFSSNRLFAKIIHPNELFLMMQKSFISPEWFILIIFTLIKCQKNQVRSLIKYFIPSKNDNYKYYDKNPEKTLKEKNDVVNNCKALDNLFIQARNADDFICILKEKQVYSEEYLNLYYHLFELFVKNERINTDDKIINK